MKKINYYKKTIIIFLIFIIMPLISNLVYATSDNKYNAHQCDLKNNGVNITCNNKQNYKLRKCYNINSQCNNTDCQNYNCNKNVLRNNNNKMHLNRQCSNCLQNNINKK